MALDNLAGGNLLTGGEKSVAQELAALCFKGVKAAELKHSDVSARPKGQKMVVKFIRMACESHTFAVDLWHKEFALLTTLVDFWVEEAMRRDGIDLYDRGGNIGLSNLTYISLRSLLPYSTFRQHLARYQTMMRGRTRESYDNFWEGLYRLFDIGDELLRDTLIWFLGAEKKLGFEHLVSMPAGMLRITNSSLFIHVMHWRKNYKDPMILVHDASSTLAHEKLVWETILGSDVPATEVGYDRRKIRFPLDVSEIRLEDSREQLPLQLVDILAGALATLLRNRIEKDYRPGYAARLKEAGILERQRDVEAVVRVPF